jgi:hypothetical protein
VDLREALDLVVLVADVAPARLDGYARRWLSRLADERAARARRARSCGDRAACSAITACPRGFATGRQPKRAIVKVGAMRLAHNRPSGG